MKIRRNHHYRHSRNTHRAGDASTLALRKGRAFLDMKGVAVFRSCRGQGMPEVYHLHAEQESLRFFTTCGKEAFFVWEDLMDEKLTRQDCISLLVRKHRELHGERYPKRSDFSDREVVAIKAFLGPWPRALEAAGIKPPRDDDRAEKNRQKRIRAKKARTAAKISRNLNQAKEKENTP